MEWQDLEEKHEAQWEKFNAQRTIAWDKVQKSNQALRAAFGDQDAKLPLSVYETIELRVRDWREAWEDNGYRAKYLLAIQKSERDAYKSQVRLSILEQMKKARENSKTKSRERDD